MKTTLSRLSFVAASAIALALALVCSPSLRADAPAADARGVFYSAVNIPSGLTPAQVQDAIVASLSGRQWTVQSKTDGQVVGHLVHRSHEAIVTLSYDDKTVQIYCVGYKIDSTTLAREKPDQPTGWLKNITNDLTKNLTRK